MRRRRLAVKTPMFSTLHRIFRLKTCKPPPPNLATRFTKYLSTLPSQSLQDYTITICLVITACFGYIPLTASVLAAFFTGPFNSGM
jgi:hypothetical protein